MDAEIEQSLGNARRLAREEDYQGAEQILSELQVLYPRRPQVYSVLAYVHSRAGHIRKAISDISEAIAINSEEPAYFFNRGRYYLESGQDQRSIDDFSRVLELCSRYNDRYYETTAYFYRAEAYVRSGYFERAKADCAHVSDGFRVWIDRIRTKEDILADCER